MKRILAHAEARRRAHADIDAAEDTDIAEVRKATRSSAENALLHALLGEIATTKEWAGQKRDIEVWKRLMTAAWCRATNQQVELMPALDGHGVDIVYRRTSQLSRRECADLITFVQAWMAEHMEVTA